MANNFRLLNIDNPLPLVAALGPRFSIPITNMPLMNALWRPKKRVSSKSYNEVEPFNFLTTKFIPRKKSPLNFTRKGLGRLPTELLGMIAKQIDDLEDIVCFAVTCQRCYDIGRRYLEDAIERTFVVSWAGNRLICIKDTTLLLGDLPSNMLTHEEIEFIEESYQPTMGYDNHNAGESEEVVEPIIAQLSLLRALHPDSSLHELKARFYQEYDSSLDSYWMRHVHRPGLAWTEIRLIRQLVKIKELRYQELHDGSSALRNLTTREYVRGDAVLNIRHTPKKPWLEEVNLQHTLLNRISWPRSSTTVASDQIWHGAWAGHRFDITPLNMVEDDGMSIAGWRNVSDEVLAEVMIVSEPGTPEMRVDS